MPLFIVLEGIDSSGKSTQASFLKDYLITKGSKAIISPEPSSGPIGNLIRETLKNRVNFAQDREKFAEQMAYLFAADRHDHLYNNIDGVFKLINDGYNVITTRYVFSSLAYNTYDLENTESVFLQSLQDDLSTDIPKAESDLPHNSSQWEFIKKLNEKFPNPDLVIYIDIPIEVSLTRLEERSIREIYETQDKLTIVKKNYQDIINNYDGLLLSINGCEDKYVIHKQITNFINNYKLSI